MSLHLRALTTTERTQAFAQESKSKVNYAEYVAALRKMQPGIAYAISANGGPSLRSQKTRFNRASKKIGVKLRWAKLGEDIVVELQ